MAKRRGGNRTLTSHSKEWKNRLAETDDMKLSGKYEEVVFDYDSGGYYAIEKGNAKHKPEEIEVAQFLSQKGYKVTLCDETGSVIVVDGKIFSSTFEQKTPELSMSQKKGIAIFDPVSNFKNALGHARDKKANIALVYSKNELQTRKDVEDGIRAYEGKANWKFEMIIVVTKDGRVHRHVHNK